MAVQNLLVRLKENRDYVSPTERNFIDFVLEDPERVVGISIHVLAAMSFVSPSTISRLCARLEIGGYKGFQHALVYDLATTREAGRTAIGDISPNDSTARTVFKVTRKNIESLSITEKLNTPDVVDTCVDLMSRAGTINLFGMGSSLLTARDLQYKLVRAGVTCNVSEDWHEQLVRAKNMSQGDLAIAFSYSGKTKEVVTCAGQARSQGADVIVVTRAGYDSDLVRLADKVLYVASTEPILRSSASASRISQLDVVDILFAAYVNKNYEKCSKAFEHNYIER